MYFTSQPMAELPEKNAAAAADVDDVELLAREIVMLEMGETTENAKEEYPELYFFAKGVLESSNNNLEDARFNLYTYLYEE